MIFVLFHFAAKRLLNAIKLGHFSNQRIHVFDFKTNKGKRTN